MFAFQGENHGFWNLDVGNLVTWAVVVGGWFWARSKHEVLVKTQVKTLQDWCKQHEEESDKRDQAIEILKTAVQRLTIIAELSEKRMYRVEKEHK